MNDHSNIHFRAGLAPTIVTLAVLGGASVAWAQSASPSTAQSGPHSPETPGLSVHTNQGLRHPASKSTFGSGLTIKVTPVALGNGGWKFRISFDATREVPADDVGATTLLVVDGKEFNATGWKTTTARRHHREGVLSFPDAGSSAKVVELRMQRQGEKSARVFRWKDAELMNGPHDQAFPHEPAGKPPVR